jgi:pyruvate dehydrogenase E2 component (dihydrolipoamide acetyltransferase)
MKGSSFGISNLGMLGVERFDAMINKDDAAIVAVGAIQDGKIAVTLTADHRLINGYEAALFMRDIKKEAQDPLNFKE